MHDDLKSTRASYDTIADRYSSEFFDELQHKPLDRALLSCFGEQLPQGFGVADVGCGPGQVTRYLHTLGLDVVGIDLSPRMVTVAGRLNPGLRFRQGSLLALDVLDGTWAGIAAFYSIIHLDTDQRSRAFAELHRALCDQGLLLLAFHVGGEVLHVDDWWGHPVSLNFHLLQPGEIAHALRRVGFIVEATVERQPYQGVEHPTRRAYMLARKSASDRLPSE